MPSHQLRPLHLCTWPPPLQRSTKMEPLLYKMLFYLILGCIVPLAVALVLFYFYLSVCLVRGYLQALREE
jgi:hypothetical protein